MSRYPREKKVRLGSRSRAFAKMLFARHPEWEPFAGYYEVQEPEFVTRYLEVRVPSANPHVLDPLLIRVMPSQVYLQWVKGWHDHVFQGWRDAVHRVPDQDLESHFEDALRVIDLWTSDEYLFGIVYRGDAKAEEWGARSEAAPPDYFVPVAGQRTEVYSWRGSGDRAV